MPSWYMTVGYPGGEFAYCAASGETIDKIDPRMCDAINALFEPCTPQRDVQLSRIRPCPPDLAEWLDADMGQIIVEPYWHRKVAGGWIYAMSAHDEFVPVAGAAGITILGVDNA